MAGPVLWFIVQNISFNDKQIYFIIGGCKND